MSGAGIPAVGRHVDGSGGSPVDDDDDGLGQVVGVEELAHRVALLAPDCLRRAQESGQPSRLLLSDRHRRSQHGGHPFRSTETPFLGTPLEVGAPDSELEVRARLHLSILGERYRVVRPGPVDHCRRQHHEVGDRAVLERGKEALGDNGNRMPRIGSGLLGPESGGQVDDRVDTRQELSKVGDRQVGRHELDAGRRPDA